MPFSLNLPYMSIKRNSGYLWDAHGGQVLILRMAKWSASLHRLKNFKKRTYEMHNTTNIIDGGVFSPIKKLFNIHNRFTKNLKLQIVNDYLDQHIFN